MLYVFYGTDTERVRKTAQDTVRTLSKGSEVQVLTNAQIVAGALGDACGATSLFGHTGVCVLDTPSEDAEAYTIVTESLEALARSHNTFVIIEGKLLVKEVKRFTEHAEKVTEFTAVTKKEFNVFALTDALCARDKKTLWVLLMDAFHNGKSAEEIIGTLFWQLKALRLAQVTKSAGESGLKPFVYDKAKRALGKFPEGELTRITHALVTLYHDGHGGKADINHALERWVLTL